jgi:hypothetical protein
MTGTQEAHGVIEARRRRVGTFGCRSQLVRRRLTARARFARGCRPAMMPHARGTEPVERFIARKVELYAALAIFPEACEKYFGLRTFEVHVSVIDTRTKAPIERLRALQEAAGESAAPSIFRFTLGGWLFDHPAEKIWLAGPPESASVRWQDHVRLTH